MEKNEQREFSELLGNVADYYNKPMTAAGLMIYWNGLSKLPLPVVKELLNLHVQTSRFMPTIAELLDAAVAMDGRPDAEEAWALVARGYDDEGATIVWTREMAEAFGVALGCGDKISARMAFKECYARSVRVARRNGEPVLWSPSLGQDPNGREGALLEAVRLGRLAAEQVNALLPNLAPVPPNIARLM